MSKNTPEKELGMKVTIESCRIGGIETKNRIVRSATFEGRADNSKISDAMVDMYRDLAHGGVGVIITGFLTISTTDNPNPKAITVTDDSSIPGLTQLAEATHNHGSKIVAQLNHATSQLFHVPENPVFGVSAVTDPISTITPKAFSTDQVKALVTEFADAAERAQKAGFDGVQIHGAHGYLFNRWMSPIFNKRTDEYGGSIEANTKVIVETLQEIKKRCGSDFPVWIKLNSSDFQGEEGVTEEIFLATSKLLAESGIDAIEVSGGTQYGEHTPARSKKFAAYHLGAAERLKKQVDTSVILVGGIRSIDKADEIFYTTKIDAISISRPLIREPGLVKRWTEGDRRDAECVACNGCFNPNGTKCFFQLSDYEKDVQKKIMKIMAGKK
jgi:2,4-dienoyl-CoA reductase-like NADH-dependent reductase (Old Yellow Enzyme family)